MQSHDDATLKVTRSTHSCFICHLSLHQSQRRTQNGVSWKASACNFREAKHAETSQSLSQRRGCCEVVTGIQVGLDSAICLSLPVLNSLRESNGGIQSAGQPHAAYCKVQTAPKRPVPCLFKAHKDNDQNLPARNSLMHLKIGRLDSIQAICSQCQMGIQACSKAIAKDGHH